MSVRLRRVLFLVASVTLAAAVFGACSGEKVIDQDKLQSEIASQLAEQTGIEEDSVSVDCPKDVKLAEGDTFDCDVTVTDEDGEEQVVTATVTQTDDDGNVTFTVGE